jgi:hypothetical protein
MAILDTGWAQSIKLITIICGLFVAHVVEVVVYGALIRGLLLD